MPSAEHENRPEDATCIVNGMSVTTTGVLHILGEVSDPAVRLHMLKINEDINRGLGTQRDLKSMRQCRACAVLFMELHDEEGVTFLHEYRPKLGQFSPAALDPADRA